MRSSRSMLYAQRLSKLSSELAELEDLRGLVEKAERKVRGPHALCSAPHASQHLRSREPRALSVRLRRNAPLSRNPGALGSTANDNQVDGAPCRSNFTTDGGLLPSAAE